MSPGKTRSPAAPENFYALPRPPVLPLHGLIPDVYKQIHDGHYDAALKLAKRLSIDFLKEGKQVQAAQALAAAAHIQCLLNSPSKAKSFAQEAYELSAR